MTLPDILKNQRSSLTLGALLLTACGGGQPEGKQAEVLHQTADCGDSIKVVRSGDSIYGLLLPNGTPPPLEESRNIRIQFSDTIPEYKAPCVVEGKQIEVSVYSPAMLEYGRGTLGP